MIYLSCQPANLYFAWQVDIMLHNFKKTSINLRDVHVVFAVVGEIDNYFAKLKAKYPEAKFFFYNDTRKDKSYISSIRPHILTKHFKENFHLRNQVIFYHDSDIVFSRSLILEDYLKDDICYLSDTVSYIGYNYIKNKGIDVFNRMIEIVDIPPDVVIMNQMDSGGAQYLMKNITPYFWAVVEKDSTNLFKQITELNNRKKKDNPDYHELQIWCADMWAVLWNLWKLGKKTKVVKELDFMFATDPIEMWDRKAIYHNAGVVDSSKGCFYKGQYTNGVPPKDLTIDNTKASYKYYEILKEAL